MIPVPEFVNQARANEEYGDTVDRLLTYLSRFMLSGDDAYLNLLFCVAEKKKKAESGREADILRAEQATEAVKMTKKWITEICGEQHGEKVWNRFVEVCFLQPFCKLDEKGIYVPLCMFSGKPLHDGLRNTCEKKQLFFLPSNLEECECFFKTCNIAIQERAGLIQKAINNGRTSDM